MTWVNPPVGLTRHDSEFGQLVVHRSRQDWAGGVDYTCAVPGGTVTCTANTTVSASISASPADAMGYLSSAPYDFSPPLHLLIVSATGPSRFLAGRVGCSTDPLFPGCGPFEAWTQDGTLDGSYVRLDNGVALSSTEHTEDFWVNLPAPNGVHQGGALVNPSPVWPTPDAYGNTFGRCLFTAAQIPAAIGAAIDCANAGLDIIFSGPATIEMSIIPYRYVVPADDATLMCLL